VYLFGNCKNYNRQNPEVKAPTLPLPNASALASQKRVTRDAIRPVLCDLCVDRLFLIGILHTEVAKVAKTDSDWVSLPFRGSSVSFAFFAISVWIVFF
jgi:hypothetical protein